MSAGAMGWGVRHKVSDQLAWSLATGSCSRTLWLAGGGTQRTVGKGSLQVEMGTTRGKAGSQNTCSRILGERGNAVKGPEAQAVWWRKRRKQ